MFLLVCLILLIFPDATANGAREGLEVALGRVACTVVPFSALMSGVIKSGQGRLLGAVLTPIFKKTGLNPYGATPFLCSGLAGYPTGCSIVCDMYEEGIIDKREAEDILSYANNGGIVFAISIVGLYAFGSIWIGLSVWACQLIGAICVGKILTQRSERVTDFRYEVNLYKKRKASFAENFGKSLTTAGGILINIVSSYVVFYAVLNALNVSKIPFAEGLCEVVKGVEYAKVAKSVPLCGMFFSFGGLNVLAQSSAVCAKYDFNMKKCFLGKLLTGIFTYVLLESGRLLKNECYESLAVILLASLVVLSGGLLLKRYVPTLLKR